LAALMVFTWRFMPDWRALTWPRLRRRAKVIAHG
jgi:hypothetical protein